MRRFRDRQPDRLFRGGELARMMTMIGMLLVLVMIIRRARCRYLAISGQRFCRRLRNQIGRAGRHTADGRWRPPDGSGSKAAGIADAQAAHEADGTVPAENAPAADVAPAAEATPPLDEDSEERAALAVEFQAITDRSPLAKEDMFAYWRLLRWTESAKLPALLSALEPTSGTAT